MFEHIDPRGLLILVVVICIGAIILLSGCAPTYYGGHVVHDRYGDEWERCRVGRYGRPAWCRVD